MKRGRGPRNVFGLGYAIIGIILILGFAYHHFNHDTVENVRATASKYGQKVDSCVKNGGCASDVPKAGGKNSNNKNNGGGGSSPSTSSAQDSNSNSGGVHAKYSRKDYKHWLPYNGRACWNTREQVLYRDGSNVKLEDGNHRPTSNVNNACYIVGGVWVDPYSGRRITDPKQLDVDHMIPLAYVHEHGGYKWDSRLKAKYANDLDVLVTTSARENRIKGAKGPSEYMPPLESYRGAYLSKWCSVARKYGIVLDSADERLAKC